MSKKFIVKSVKINKIKSAEDLIDLFIWVAKNHPNQASKLFNRYVSDICRHKYTLKNSRHIAALNLRLLSDSRGVDEYNLLLRTVPGLRQY